jgi:hypothetical protein
MKKSGEVITKNDKTGETRIFTQKSWDLLGKVNKSGTKHGWREITGSSAELIKPAAKSTTPPPPTGQKVVKTEGEIIKPVVDDKIETSDVITEEKKGKFLELISTLTKPVIKDFFDNQNPSVKYENKATAKALQLQLAEFAKYNEETIKDLL